MLNRPNLRQIFRLVRARRIVVGARFESGMSSPMTGQWSVRSPKQVSSISSGSYDFQ